MTQIISMQSLLGGPPKCSPNTTNAIALSQVAVSKMSVAVFKHRWMVSENTCISVENKCAFVGMFLSPRVKAFAEEYKCRVEEALEDAFEASFEKEAEFLKTLENPSALSSKTINLIVEYAKNCQGIKGFIFKLWQAIAHIFGKQSDASTINFAINRDFAPPEDRECIFSFDKDCLKDLLPFAQEIEKSPKDFLEYRSADKEQLRNLTQRCYSLISQYEKTSQDGFNFMTFSGKKDFFAEPANMLATCKREILSLETGILELQSALGVSAYAYKDEKKELSLKEGAFVPGKQHWDVEMNRIVELRKKIKKVSETENVCLYSDSSWLSSC